MIGPPRFRRWFLAPLLLSGAMVRASNRADPESHQTNLYIARWAD